MSELFASGLLVDLIIGLTVLEGLLLALWQRKTGRGITPAALFGNLLAGIFLLLALRAALAQAHWSWLALCLTAALLAHLFDLHHRWRG